MTFEATFPSSIARIGAPTFVYGQGTAGSVVISREIDGDVHKAAVSLSAFTTLAQAFAGTDYADKEKLDLTFSEISGKPGGFPLGIHEIITFVAAFTRYRAVEAAKLALELYKESSDSDLLEKFAGKDLWAYLDASPVAQEVSFG